MDGQARGEKPNFDYTKPALLIRNMNVVGAVREPPLQQTRVTANHI